MIRLVNQCTAIMFFFLLCLISDCRGFLLLPNDLQHHKIIPFKNIYHCLCYISNVMCFKPALASGADCSVMVGHWPGQDIKKLQGCGCVLNQNSSLVYCSGQLSVISFMYFVLFVWFDTDWNNVKHQMVTWNLWSGWRLCWSVLRSNSS